MKTYKPLALLRATLYRGTALPFLAPSGALRAKNDPRGESRWQRNEALGVKKCALAGALRKALKAQRAR